MDVKEEPTDCTFYYTVDTKLCQLPSKKGNTNIDYLSETQHIHDDIQESKDYMLMNIKSDELIIKDEMLTEPDNKDEDYADVSPVKKKFECDIYNPSHKHLKTHAGEKSYACSICEYTTSRQSKLKFHLLTHIGEKPYACNICEYTASQKSHLATHLLTHSGEKAYVCNICEYRAPLKSRLAIHLLTHSGEKPYACNICEYRASQKSHLATHLLTHSGERPYACNICEYRASHKQRLQSHLKTHAGEKPLSM